VRAGVERTSHHLGFLDMKSIRSLLKRRTSGEIEEGEKAEPFSVTSLRIVITALDFRAWQK
jgi:hypothetical protein